MDDARERTPVLLMPRDLIHREVLDPNDQNVGFVRDLLIDEADWKVRFLHVTQGGFLGLDERHCLVPIEAVSYVGGGFVKTELSKEQVHGSPELDPNIRRTQNYAARSTNTMVTLPPARIGTLEHARSLTPIHGSAWKGSVC